MSEPSTYRAAMNRIEVLEDRIRTLEAALREIRHGWLKLSELTGRQYDLARLDLFNVIDSTTSAALSPETPEGAK